MVLFLTLLLGIFRRAALAEELAVLRQVDEFASKGISPPREKNGFSRYKLFNNFLLGDFDLDTLLFI